MKENKIKLTKEQQSKILEFLSTTSIPRMSNKIKKENK